MEIITTTLRGHKDLEFLGKLTSGRIFPVTYANRTQAYKKVEQLGEGWTVYQLGRPFFVARPIVVAPPVQAEVPTVG